jgi:hypothetical protein
MRFSAEMRPVIEPKLFRERKISPPSDKENLASTLGAPLDRGI